jgi:DNA primase
MPRIPEETIEEIRQRADIADVVGAYVPLKQRGHDAWGCCPFHKEKTPSFKVSSTYQSYKCFGCGKSGSVFGFIQDIENVDFVDAVRLLAQRTGVEIPESGPEVSPEERKARRDDKQRGLDLLALAADWYRKRLTAPDARAARLYLNSRGLDKAVADHFCIGYAPDSFDETMGWALQQGYSTEDLLATGLATRNEEHPERPPYDRFRGRVMFTIHDELGKVIGFSGRVLDPEAKTAKYVNSPETEFFHKSRVLYGFHLARNAFKEAGCALVCEGQLDVIACHRAGLTHAVSAQGTAFTEDQVRRLKRSTERVILAFDADSAGRKAALRSIELCHAAGISVGVVALPKGEDPDSLYFQHGAEALQKALARVTEAIPFAFSCAIEDVDATSPEGMNSVVREVLSLIVPIPTPVTRVAHARWLAQALSLPEEPVLQTMDQMLQRQTMVGGGSQRGGAPQRQQAGGYRDFRNDSGPPVFVPPPPMIAPSQEDVALCMLMELALLCEPASRLVAEKLPDELLPETPVGQAIDLVLAEAEDGNWEAGVGALRRRDDLLANPEIGRILLSEQHRGLNPDGLEGKDRERVMLKLEKAVTECVTHLRIRRLEREIAANQQQQAVATDAETARRLQQENFEMVMEKQRLRQTIGE